ncbi:hypothetical protein NDU88_001490 [Pleurodeles waltl]|uniref:Uncharacterized protein n=1 Tax=Pleurodeles waltl TaxID=8319 RepID=A0AAV7R7D9_PLEWA|nr:hypothetical protein NDU88_001490 [Pleurodeles waltl]
MQRQSTLRPRQDPQPDPGSSDPTAQELDTAVNKCPTAGPMCRKVDRRPPRGMRMGRPGQLTNLQCNTHVYRNCTLDLYEFQVGDS